MDTKRVALFIDYDNAHLSASDLCLRHCRESFFWVTPLINEIESVTGGVVDLRRSYGNVMLNAAYAFKTQYRGSVLRDNIDLDQDLQRDLFNNGFQMVHTPDFSGKNRADILMTLDCMEVAANHCEISTFAILSQDSDFSPLIHRLRAMGKDVACITVGNKTFQGKRSMTSMANHVVIYDQDVVDRCGFDVLNDVIKALAADESAPLAAGVGLSVVLSRMHQILPGFSYEALGYDQFIDFVRDCLDDIEPPTCLESDRLKLSDGRQPVSRTRKASSNGGDGGKQTADHVCATQPVHQEYSSENALKYFTILNKQNLRPIPSLRARVHEYLVSLYSDDANRPSHTWKAVSTMVDNEFSGGGVSKSMLGDVMNALIRSGSVEVAPGEGGTLVDSVVTAVLEPDDIRLARFYLSRIESTGAFVTYGDFDALSEVLFGDKGSDHVDAIRSVFIDAPA